MVENFILENPEVYKLSREISVKAWVFYNNLDLDKKIILGQQFVKSVDSVGANIAEGYGRYHFLDKMRFYYNARASLIEAIHWVDLMQERDLISQNEYDAFIEKAKYPHLKLNGWIKYNRENKSPKTNKQINQ